jgi:hypothetical protein
MNNIGVEVIEHLHLESTLENKEIYENDELTKNEKRCIPKTVFIIPYRDRKEHLYFFNIYMKHLLEDWNQNEYEIYFAHQCDTRPFNRGAMKNIGFLVIKEKYPNDYKNITFVFHDVDTLPYKKNLISYSTNINEINHFYGYKFALGGMFAIKGVDFEKINGFPNIWAWGFEDNDLQTRALNGGLKITRDEFNHSGSRNILQFIDGIKRIILRRDRPNEIYDEYKNDGIKTINRLLYEIMPQDSNSLGYMINITNFASLKDAAKETYEEYDILKNRGKIYNKHSKAGNMRSIFSFR